MTAPQRVEGNWNDDVFWSPEDVAAALPARAAAPRRPVRRMPSGPGDIASILHVEPLRAARRILRITLEHPRIHLTQVETGEAAIELLALRPFDLVLLWLGLTSSGGSDTSISSMSAAETLTWIRSSTPRSDIPVIGVRDGRSAMRASDRIGRLMSRGLTDWVMRPIDRRTINQKLVALLPALYDAGL